MKRQSAGFAGFVFVLAAWICGFGCPASLAGDFVPPPDVTPASIGVDASAMIGSEVRGPAHSNVDTMSFDLGPALSRLLGDLDEGRAGLFGTPALRRLPASAPEEMAEPRDERSGTAWELSASVYLWLAARSGHVDTSNATLALDDPEESAGAFVYVEGNHERFGFVLDVNYLQTDDRVRGLAGPIEIEETSLIVEADLTYRPAEESTLQFLAGVRVLDNSQEIEFPLLGKEKNDFTQVDPVVGAQGTWPLGEHFRFRLRGDIGGFGASSDWTYQVLGLFAWEFLPSLRLTAGYRILGYEYSEHGIDTDLRLSGWIFGLAATF